MNIQSITPVSFMRERSSVKVQPKRENTDRMATVQDLYESEDRIKAHQELLIHQQNQALANAMTLLVHMHKNTCSDPDCKLKKD